jgi:D-alanine-D-alanine ligase
MNDRLGQLSIHAVSGSLSLTMRRLHVALVYNSSESGGPDLPEDRAGMADLRKMIRMMARVLRGLRHAVTVLPLAHDLFAFQRRLRRLDPDVVFNQYDDNVHGAIYEMRFAALVRMMGYPMTGSSALAIGLARYKYMVACLLNGVGVPVPPNTAVLESTRGVDQHKWQFPLIVQAAQEHAGIGLDRDSVVWSKQALKRKVRDVVTRLGQPALVQRFLPGREFNVSILGNWPKARVLPLAEVNYQELPADIPPIMSYAAKWIETSPEYQIGRVSLAAFRAIGARGYARIDVRLDEAGQPYVLDVNCNPCLDEGLGLARSAEKAGIAYPQLLQTILRAALEPAPYDVDLPMLPERKPRPLANASANGGTAKA